MPPMQDAAQELCNMLASPPLSGTNTPNPACNTPQSHTPALNTSRQHKKYKTQVPRRAHIQTLAASMQQSKYDQSQRHGCNFGEGHRTPLDGYMWSRSTQAQQEMRFVSEIESALETLMKLRERKVGDGGRLRDHALCWAFGEEVLGEGRDEEGSDGKVMPDMENPWMLAMEERNEWRGRGVEGARKIFGTTKKGKEVDTSTSERRDETEQRVVAATRLERRNVETEVSIEDGGDAVVLPLRERKRKDPTGGVSGTTEKRQRCDDTPTAAPAPSIMRLDTSNCGWYEEWDSYCRKIDCSPSLWVACDPP